MALPPPQVRVRCGNRIRSFFPGTVAQIDRAFIAAALTIAEDEPVGANTFFFNQVIDDGIYPVPAQLLSGLARLAITDYGDLAARIVPHLGRGTGQQCLVVLAQRNRVALEGDTRKVADIALSMTYAQRIDQVLQVVAALRIRAFPYTIGIDG